MRRRSFGTAIVALCVATAFVTGCAKTSSVRDNDTKIEQLFKQSEQLKYKIEKLEDEARKRKEQEKGKE